MLIRLTYSSLTASLILLGAASQALAQPSGATDPAGTPAPSVTPIPPEPAPSGGGTKAAAPAAETTPASGETPASPPDRAPVVEDAVLVFPPPPAGTGGIAVFPVAGTNLTEGETAALGILFASELRNETRARVIAPDTARKYSSDPSDREKAAAYMQVERYMAIEAVRLDKTTIVTATLHNSDGSVVRSEEMATKSVDDFQFVSERLVLALLHGTPVQKTMTLDNVTAEEGHAKNRTFVEKVFGIKTMFIYPIAAGAELPTIVGAGFNGRLETKRYFLEFGAGLLIPASTLEGEGESLGYGGVFAEVGGSYYLTATNISPYVGLGVSPRILSSQLGSLAAYGQGGVMFFRTSSTRLYVELRVAQNLTPMEFTDYSYNDVTYEETSTTTTLWPTEFGLNVGLGW